MCACRPLFFQERGPFYLLLRSIAFREAGRVAGVLGEESSLSSSREMFWISHAGKNLALVVLPDGAVHKIFFFAMRQYDCRMDTRTRSSQWMIFFRRARAGKISEATAAKERKGGLFRQVPYGKRARHHRQDTAICRLRRDGGRTMHFVNVKSILSARKE